MRHLIITLIITAILGGNLIAQEKESLKKGEMKLVIINDENGKVTSFDSTFSSESLEDVKVLLKEKGIDFNMNRENQFQYKNSKPGHIYIHEEEGGDGQHKSFVKVIKTSNGESEDDMQVEVIMDMVEDELDKVNKEFEFNTEDGKKYEFKINSFHNDDDSESEIIKTYVIRKEGDGKFEEQLFTMESDVMIFIKEDKGNHSTNMPKEIEQNSIPSLELENLELFPNPSNGAFTMSFESKSRKDYTINITDSKGSVVFEKELRSFKGRFREEFNLSNEESGLYFFNIISGDQKESKKIIVQ